MSDITTTSVNASTPTDPTTTDEAILVKVEHVTRETTQSPKRAEELPYRPKMFKGYTDKWYRDMPPEGSEDDIPGGEDDSKDDTELSV